MALDNLFVLPSIRMNSESHLTAISNQGASDELPARATVFQSFIYSCWMRRGGYLCEGGKWLTYTVCEEGCPDDENRITILFTNLPLWIITSLKSYFSETFESVY